MLGFGIRTHDPLYHSIFLYRLRTPLPFQNALLFTVDPFTFHSNLSRQPSHNPYFLKILTGSFLVCGPFHSALTYPPNISNTSRCLFLPARLHVSAVTQLYRKSRNIMQTPICPYTLHPALLQYFLTSTTFLASPILFHNSFFATLSIFNFPPLPVPAYLAPLSIFVCSQFWCTSHSLITFTHFFYELFTLVPYFCVDFKCYEISKIAHLIHSKPKHYRAQS